MLFIGTRIVYCDVHLFADAGKYASWRDMVHYVLKRTHEQEGSRVPQECDVKDDVARGEHPNNY
jgi:hypothetical protein